VLVEASEKMREIQKAKLSDRITALGGSLSWESDVEQIPECESALPRGHA
jgi:SAM-dependent MidA family methyltransferase